MGGSSSPPPAPPSVDDVAPPPPPPTASSPAVSAAFNNQQTAGRTANGKGFASTILTTPQGILVDPSQQPLHPQLLGA